jgi:hypothetical protein
MALLISLVKAGAGLGVPATGIASGQFDWESLVRTASWHGVMPLVAHGLHDYAGEVPPLIQHEVDAYRALAARRSFVLASETVRLQSAIAARGVLTLAWKGSSLAAQLYPELWLREAVDLDFLVSADELQSAEHASLAAGFTRVTGEWRPQEVRFWERCTRDVKLRRVAGNINVELHDSFMNRSFPQWQNIGDVRARHITVKLCGCPIQTLAPEDLIVSLCAHGMTHGWERLKWICDVAAFLKLHRETLDWAALLHECRIKGSARALLLGVGLAADLLGASIPPALRPAMAWDRVLSRLRTGIAARIQSGQLQTLKGWTLAQTCALTMERRSHRWRYLLQRMVQLTDEDLDYCSLPGALFYLRYPLRAWRLLGQRVRGHRELHAGPA